MKLKVGDPFAEYAEVFLDGEQVQNPIEACEEGRWVRAFATNSNGAVVVSPAGGSVTMTQSGTVEIRFPPGIRTMAEYTQVHDGNDPLAILAAD